MSVTIRARIETDLPTVAKMLTLTDLPAAPRPSHVRAEVNALLAHDGLRGCLHRYYRHLHDLTDDEAREHHLRLDRCRTLAAQAFPPPTSRSRPPRSTPVGRPLIDVLNPNDTA
jgi:hypothetical protein